MAQTEKPHVRCTLASGKQQETNSPELRARTDEDARKLDECHSSDAESQADGTPEPTRYLAEQAREAERNAAD